MGSAVSVRSLIKPKDCSVEVWKKILLLFDKLDSDGTCSIEDGELIGHIATLHVENNILQLENNKRPFNINIEFKKEKIQSDLEINIKKLQKEAQEDIQNLIFDTRKLTSEADKSIATLNQMSIEEKAKKIRHAICGNKKSIEFWDFYKYMKNRADDIPNIIW